MQDRVEELMDLTTVDIQRQALATLIAIIESNDEYDDVRIAAINVLPQVQESFNQAAKYYDEVYEDLYEDVIEEIESEEDDEEKEGFTHVPCYDEKLCKKCEQEGKDCIGADCGNCINPRDETYMEEQ